MRLSVARSRSTDQLRTLASEPLLRAHARSIHAWLELGLGLGLGLGLALGLGIKIGLVLGLGWG